MSLSDLASIGSFISGVAVVVTLVLLLIQTRQTNRNQKALMQQGRSARTVELLMTLSEPRAEAGDLALTSAEVRSYFMLCGGFFWNYEDSFLQFRAGTLDRASWENDLASLKQFAALSSARMAWTFVRSFSGGTYRDFVDNLMLETTGGVPPDLSDIWKSGMTAARAPT
jgi:hypothetical protein